MAWFDRQVFSSLYLTAINLAEIYQGIAMLSDGRRKEALRATVKETLEQFLTPILPFDEVAAMEYASLVARAKLKRYTLPVADGQIAAIAAVHGYTVATRDVEPFVAVGVKVVNPWEFEG